MNTDNYFTKTFPALTYHNFRLFFFGQCISTIGTWMQTIAQSWLVLELTKSDLLLGLLAAVQFLPVLLFSLFGGTLADWLPKRKVLLVTQSVFAILATILAVLTYTKQIEYWMILILAFILGLFNAIDMPTRQSFYSEVVQEKALGNAIMLNSTVFNLARLLGPAIAALLIGLFGLTICFTLNALSYVAVIIALFQIKLPAQYEQFKTTKLNFKIIYENMKSGLHYMTQSSKLYLPAITMLVVNIFLMNYTITLPIYSANIVNAGVTGYSLLTTCMGVGSLMAAIFLTVLSKGKPKSLVLYGSGILCSCFLILLGFSNSFLMAGILMIFIGLTNITLTISVNTSLQLNAKREMRGRIMGVYSFILGGTTPIGSLYTGIISQTFGIAACLSISGTIGLIGIIIVSYISYFVNKRTINQ